MAGDEIGKVSRNQSEWKVTLRSKNAVELCEVRLPCWQSSGV